MKVSDVSNLYASHTLLIHMYMYRTIYIQRWCILLQAKSNALILPMLARL